MKNQQQQLEEWKGFLSPLQISLLAINGVCFGGSIVLLALGKGSVLLALGTGGMFFAGAAGALIASKKLKRVETLLRSKDPDSFDREIVGGDSRAS